jgi:hypothetical protein
MNSVFKYITNKPFWVNLVAAILIVVLFLVLFLKMLGWLTKHGQYLKVPAARTIFKSACSYRYEHP